MMSTFLSEVIQLAEEAEVKDLNESIHKISKRIHSLKYEMKKVIDDTCHLIPVGNVHLVDQAKILMSEMERINNKIEKQTKNNLHNSTGELKSISFTLQEANLSLQFVNQIMELDLTLQASCREQSEGHYLNAAKKLKHLEALVGKTNHENLDILKALVKERVVYVEKFLYDMKQLWAECLSLDEEDGDRGGKHVCLRVDTSRLHQIESMFQALNFLEQLDFSFKKFSMRILKLILVPVIKKESCVDVMNCESDAVLVVVSKETSSKPHFSSVFENLTKVFQFFGTYLSVEIESDMSAVRKLGEMISDDFCEVLIKNCLEDTVPNHSNDFDKYSEVAALTEALQVQLSSIGFFGERNKSIVEYARNVDVLFANKTCQLYLTSARNIMKKDLHEMVKVGPEEPSNTLFLTSEVKKEPEVEPSNTSFLTSEVKKEPEVEPSIKLSPNTFQFPKCQISKSTRELLELVHDILEEAVQSSDLCSVRLFYTARNVFELYRAVVPAHHSRFLETIPQQVALFHNNCMYLAHHLPLLGHGYHDRLPPILRSHTTTFIDQVSKLRHLGASIFLKHTQNQRKQILDILRDSGLTNLGEGEGQSSSIEKSIRQCLRQLELLQVVWSDVLPLNVYSKSIGCLLNSFIEELIIRILTVEDISADAAIMLVRVFGLVSARAPHIFQDPKEVLIYAKLWQRFQELILVLGASLKDIEARWFNGAGPLAHYFSPEEVKQLIRALFQNTERRSALLAQIK